MLRASVSAIGWVVGGPDVVLSAILEVIGLEGTLTHISQISHLGAPLTGTSTAHMSRLHGHYGQ